MSKITLQELSDELVEQIQNGSKVENPDNKFFSGATINGKTLIANKPNDIANVILDQMFTFDQKNNKLFISHRMLKDKKLELSVDPKNGTDDNVLSPFKTIQGALNYIKFNFIKLEKGAIIKIAPGIYSEHLEVSNFGSEYNDIELANTMTSQLLDQSKDNSESKYVILENVIVNNNSARIIFTGFKFTCKNIKNVNISNESGTGHKYCAFLKGYNNSDLIFSGCRVEEGAANGQFTFNYGIVVSNGNLEIRNSVLVNFHPALNGGTTAPVRIDGTRSTFLYCEFDNNESFDFITEESFITVRRCKERDGHTIKYNSGTSYVKQAD